MRPGKGEWWRKVEIYLTCKHCYAHFWSSRRWQKAFWVGTWGILPSPQFSACMMKESLILAVGCMGSARGHYSNAYQACHTTSIHCKEAMQNSQSSSILNILLHSLASLKAFCSVWSRIVLSCSDIISFCNPVSRKDKLWLTWAVPLVGCQIYWRGGQ